MSQSGLRISSLFYTAKTILATLSPERLTNDQICQDTEICSFCFQYKSTGWENERDHCATIRQINFIVLKILAFLLILNVKNPLKIQIPERKSRKLKSKWSCWCKKNEEKSTHTRLSSISHRLLITINQIWNWKSHRIVEDSSTLSMVEISWWRWRIRNNKWVYLFASFYSFCSLLLFTDQSTQPNSYQC